MEDLRERLYKLILVDGVESKEVLKLSEELDYFIKKFYEKETHSKIDNTYSCWKNTIVTNFMYKDEEESNDKMERGLLNWYWRDW